tara:strand:+ start:243 stop:542 length:300 start_codon:yes stop_codon:yes gene_type:complete
MITFKELKEKLETLSKLPQNEGMESTIVPHKLEYDLNNIGKYDYTTVSIECGNIVDLENIELRNLRITSQNIGKVTSGSFLRNTIVFTVRHYLETNIEY